MFGASPPWRNDAVNAFGCLDVLAQVRDRLICEQQTVERVDTPMRHRGCVCSATVILDAHLGDADAWHGGQIDSRRMNHHRRIDAVERAGSRHQFFAAAFLFRRRPQQPNGAAQAIANGDQAERGAQSGGRDQIVSARVADAGERIVFGKQRNARPGGGSVEFALEGGFQAIGRPFHREPGRRERVAQQAARVVLVESEFRMGVDVVRHADEFFRERVDPARDDLFQFGGHGSTPGHRMGLAS